MDVKDVALLAEGVDRNFHAIALVIVSTAWSPSSQRAWIEISSPTPPIPAPPTSPSSQRAWIEIASVCHAEPAARSPSSQRAWIEIAIWQSLVRKPLVALLAEGVDRNFVIQQEQLNGEKSPSSQRAWIEIMDGTAKLFSKTVALLAEGVDRNGSRGQWKERRGVALLAEGVDRNDSHTVLLTGKRRVALLAEGVDRNMPSLLRSA